MGPWSGVCARSFGHCGWNPGGEQPVDCNQWQCGGNRCGLLPYCGLDLSQESVGVGGNVCLIRAGNQASDFRIDLAVFSAGGRLASQTRAANPGRDCHPEPARRAVGFLCRAELDSGDSHQHDGALGAGRPFSPGGDRNNQTNDDGQSANYWRLLSRRPADLRPGGVPRVRRYARDLDQSYLSAATITTEGPAWPRRHLGAVHASCLSSGVRRQAAAARHSRLRVAVGRGRKAGQIRSPGDVDGSRSHRRYSLGGRHQPRRPCRSLEPRCLAEPIACFADSAGAAGPAAGGGVLPVRLRLAIAQAVVSRRAGGGSGAGHFSE